MNLAQLDNPTLTPTQRVLLRCHLASEFIHVGQYENAREALGELWQGIGRRPNIEEMEEKIAGEVLLQCGSLSGRIGSSGQVKGVQESAKDLISESITLFASAGDVSKVAIARSHLALCYWREGAYEEARVLLIRALDELPATEVEQRAKVLLRRVTVEYSAGSFNQALELLKDSAYIFDASSNHALKGSFHNLFALMLRRLATAEGQADYFDRAIVEYTAAIYHYEQAQHDQHRALNENNLAFLLNRLGRYSEAHEQLDRARRTLVRLKDEGFLAQIDETRARVFMAEEKYREANRVIDGAIRVLEKGGESALLADALTTQGVTWARLGNYDSSINILRRAMCVAEESGARSNAGLAALTLIEEHGAKRLSQTELYKLYARADKLLNETQDAENTARLRMCARIVLKRLSGARIHDKGFTLYGAMRDYEAKFIEQALEEADGSITQAAKLLGIRYQSLDHILNNRHKRLLKKRTPPKRRVRSIFRKE